ncbi:MAG: type I 3-dehydroquinate dehydratase [Treponema sp.]|jgi:3-dehydroquinate dehydratase/shikimate dehydrogenase|nr:type I 3-dehydroquinate dehydratase [Treponema sp.]
MAKLCLCLTAKTLERNLAILEKYRKYVDLAELRVDCLAPDERFLIRRFPEQAGLPVILTIRRNKDGGHYNSGEGSRINLLSRGLAFADADRRRNFAYVDLEEDLNVPSLEEAARTFGTRIIRSYHNTRGVDADIAGRLRSMSHVGDELIKMAVTPHSTEDVWRVFKAGKETAKLDKILLCMGPYGVPTRILAEKMGSFLSYTSALEEDDAPAAAPGQMDAKELSELYRFREINAETRIFGVVGFPLKYTGSPIFFNTIFDLENTNAVYVPFPADSMESFMKLAAEIGLEGVSVTVPYKEAVLLYLSQKDQTVNTIKACNTLVRFSGGWLGTNTDTLGFSDSLLDFIGAKNLRGKKITIIGAGGAAKAVASEVHRLGGKALILNRTALRARSLAIPYKFAWGALDNRGVELMDKYQDIIIQTTPAGMEGSDLQDPLVMYSFSGREKVMDLVYKSTATPFLKRAAGAGCRTLNGYDMLIRQARYQYTQFMGKEFPPQLLSRVRFG